MSSANLSWQHLRAELAQDCAPVAPLRPMRSLVPWVLAVSALTLVALLLVFGLRSDAAALGPAWLWLPSVFEMIMALGLIAAGMQEAIPTRGQTVATVAIGVMAGATTHLVVAAATFANSPITAAPDARTQNVVLCVAMELALAVPVLVAALVVLSRGLVLRPLRAGICLGIGAGVAGDALWRLVCPFASLDHVLGAHLPGLVVAVVAGALLGVIWERVRVRGWRAERPLASHRAPAAR